MTDQEKEQLKKAIERAEETKTTLEKMVAEITAAISDMKKKAKG